MQKIMAEFENLPSYYRQNIYHEDISKKEIPQNILSYISVETAIKFHAVPLEIKDGRLVIATDTEQTFKQRGQLEEAISYKGPIKIVLTREDYLQQALSAFYKAKNFGKNKSNSFTNSVLNDEDITPLRSSLNSMIQAAAALGASDIHILPHSQGVYVHLRIHGHMVDYTSTYNFDGSQALNITNLIKQMDTSGRVDQTRTNMPNEGSFSIIHNNEEIFIRMETLPIGNQGNAEKINLRLLPQASSSGEDSNTSIDELGYLPDDLAVIKRVLYKNATGIFITSGPTGAGKTTSLYSQIKYVVDLANEPLNVITMDDPIEIREERFTQVQVREAQSEDISLTDIKIMKAGLRSDPDIFLYNEIRDSDAAEVAIQASTTGHKTFSTVHAADCVKTITRLLDLNVSKYSLLSELKLIISQRLVATLCPHCAIDHNLTDEELSVLTDEEKRNIDEGLNKGEFKLKSRNLSRREHCPHCNNGLKGRVAVAEYIEITDELRDDLMSAAGFRKTKESLKKANFKSMWEKGLDLALHGKVELGEIIRVIGHD